MAVKLLFFAQCADWAGRREFFVDVRPGDTVASLLDESPSLRPLKDRRSFLRVAVNLEMAAETQEVKDGDEIAFMPPFSGG